MTISAAFVPAAAFGIVVPGCQKIHKKDPVALAVDPAPKIGSEPKQLVVVVVVAAAAAAAGKDLQHTASFGRMDWRTAAAEHAQPNKAPPSKQ